MAEEKAGKTGEILDFSRGLERRWNQGVAWFAQTVKKQDLTRRHRRDEQAEVRIKAWTKSWRKEKEKQEQVEAKLM